MCIYLNPQQTSATNILDGKLTKIYERVSAGKPQLLDGPETVVLDDDSNIFTFSHGGKILKLMNLDSSPNDDNIIYADVIEIAKSVGQPLGGKFVPDTQILYFADAVLGLCRIDLSQKFPKIELVASQVEVQGKGLTPILYADDIDIGKSGKVYFSDATDIAPYRDSDSAFNVQYAYKLDTLRGEKRGRLLCYDPHTDSVEVLGDGIWFANGIAVDKDSESFVLVAETNMFRVLKYHLAGPQKGQMEVAISRLSGFVDGVDCKNSNTCYAAIPSGVVALVKVFSYLPTPLAAFFKTIVMMLPKTIVTNVAPTLYTGFVEFNPKTGKMTQVFQDLTGSNVDFITGVTEKDGKMYLGSLEAKYIAVVDLI